MGAEGLTSLRGQLHQNLAAIYFAARALHESLPLKFVHSCRKGSHGHIKARSHYFHRVDLVQTHRNDGVQFRNGKPFGQTILKRAFLDTENGIKRI